MPPEHYEVSIHIDEKGHKSQIQPRLPHYTLLEESTQKTYDLFRETHGSGDNSPIGGNKSQPLTIYL